MTLSTLTSDAFVLQLGVAQHGGRQKCQPQAASCTSARVVTRLRAIKRGYLYYMTFAIIRERFPSVGGNATNWLSQNPTRPLVAVTLPRPDILSRFRRGVIERV